MPNQPTPENGLRATLTPYERFALSLGLAALVRAAERVPEGSPCRRAFAQAARPLRDALFAT